jgi:hypothetical protein
MNPYIHTDGVLASSPAGWIPPNLHPFVQEQMQVCACVWKCCVDMHVCKHVCMREQANVYVYMHKTMRVFGSERASIRASIRAGANACVFFFMYLFGVCM